LSKVCRRHTFTAEGRLPLPELLETFITMELRWIKVKAVLLGGRRKIKAVDVTLVGQRVFIGPHL